MTDDHRASALHGSLLPEACSPRANDLFITGTDTGVGKSVVASGLARALRHTGISVAAMKPVETGHSGSDWPADAAALATAAWGLPSRRDDVVPYCFEPPVAPLVAARSAGVTIEPAVIAEAYRRCSEGAQVTLVEGAGGLSVPITARIDMAGLSLGLGLRVLVVARPDLGTLNHTFLTISYARARGLDVAGVVLCHSHRPEDRSDPSRVTNAAMIEEMCAVPVLGTVPWIGPTVDSDSAATAISENVDLTRLWPSTLRT